ncbi:MAG: response regulator [candidate division Zixibacteria bacterium]|nr:response regulator [candidate division Zixibacteria bacterium]
MTNRGNRRVLVIDDEVFVRDLLIDFFEKLDFEPVTAADGNAGVDAFRQGTFSAVLVDLKMPGKSGIETLSDIRAIDTKTPVIIMTGYPTIDTSIEALRLGAYDYIIKPFKLQDLRDIVDRAIREQELHAEIDTLRDRITNIESQLREHRAQTAGRPRVPESS